MSVRFKALFIASLLGVVVGVSASNVATANGAVCPGSYSLSLATGGPQFNVRLHSYENGAQGKDLFLVHGFGHRANYFSQLITSLMSDPAFDGKIRQIYALDLPGHGESGYPYGIWAELGSTLPKHHNLGTISFNDYVDVVEQVLGKVKSDCANGAVEILGGHSMGGLVVQGLQQHLKQQGGVVARYGSEGVLNLASALPEDVRWLYGEGVDPAGALTSTQLSLDLLPILRAEPGVGSYALPTDRQFKNLFYRPRGSINPIDGAPGSTVEIDQIRSKEPLQAGLELVGLDSDLARPRIDQHLYSGLRLASVHYEKDYFFREQESFALHSYLVGADQQPSEGYFINGGKNAVHDGEYTLPPQQSLLVGTKQALLFLL